MFTESRIGMFVERGTVKPGKAVRVLREMRRDPVEQDPDSFPVAGIDKETEIVSRTITAGWRKVTGGLVTPGGIVGMLGNGQQLDVRETHFTDIVDQSFRQLPVGKKLSLRATLPGPYVHLVYRHGCMLPVQ